MGRRKGTARQLIKQDRKTTQTKYDGEKTNVIIERERERERERENEAEKRITRKD
jgi:hypothetical protein